jgi:hypothetical protein
MSDKYIFIISVVLIATIILTCISKTEGYSEYANKGQKCGLDNGNKACNEKLCCSEEGICGSTQRFCEKTNKNIKFSDKGLGKSLWRLKTTGRKNILDQNKEVVWVLRSEAEKPQVAKIQKSTDGKKTWWARLFN